MDAQADFEAFAAELLGMIEAVQLAELHLSKAATASADDADAAPCTTEALDADKP